MNGTFPRLGKCEHNKLVKRIAPDFSRQKALTWREKKEDDTKKNTPNQIPCDTMMSFFTASPTKETNLKSSDVKMKEEAKSRVCAACARVCTLLPLCRCFESFVLPCARLLRWGLISIGFDCILRWVNVHLRACMCVCVYSQEQHNSGSSEIFFSFLFLILRSSCSSYCHCFPHPPLLPCLPNEGTGKFYLHFFENVITIIMTMIVLMIIIVLVVTKGAESERVSSSWGEATSAPWFQGLEM